MKPDRIALSLLAVVALGVCAAPMARAELIASNGAMACTQMFPQGRLAPFPSSANHTGYSRFAFTNLDYRDSAYVTCNLPTVRGFELGKLQGSNPGFDLGVIVKAEGTAAVTITCTAEVYDGNAATRFSTTRSIGVSGTQAARLHFDAADLPASSAFGEVAMTCLLPAHTSIGLIYLREPDYRQ